MCLKIAASELFRERQRQTIANARALGEALQSGGLDVLTGGTDVHLVLVDLGMDGLDGKEAEDRLAEVGITVNRNAIPFDQRPPMRARVSGSARRRSRRAAWSRMTCVRSVR